MKVDSISHWFPMVLPMKQRCKPHSEWISHGFSHGFPLRKPPFSMENGPLSLRSSRPWRCQSPPPSVAQAMWPGIFMACLRGSYGIIQQIYTTDISSGLSNIIPIYNRYFPNYPIRVWINTYENTIFRGMNIHFNPAILMWTEGVLLVLTHCHMGLWSYWYGIYVTPISLISVI